MHPNTPDRLHKFDTSQTEGRADVQTQRSRAVLLGLEKSTIQVRYEAIALHAFPRVLKRSESLLFALRACLDSLGGAVSVLSLEQGSHAADGILEISHGHARRKICTRTSDAADESINALVEKVQQDGGVMKHYRHAMMESPSKRHGIPMTGLLDRRKV